jgi:hypothetical protein
VRVQTHLEITVEIVILLAADCKNIKVKKSKEVLELNALK